MSQVYIFPLPAILRFNFLVKFIEPKREWSGVGGGMG